MAWPCRGPDVPAGGDAPNAPPRPGDHRKTARPMPRRFVFVLALAFLGLVALAAAPWTLSGDGLAAGVSRHLLATYGLRLDVRGRSTLALLPVPRVKFENIRLTGGGIEADGGTLRAEMRLLPLIGGRIDLAEVTLAGSRVAVPGGPAAIVEGPLTPRLKARLSQQIGLRRVVVTGTDVRWPEGRVDDVNLVFTLPGGDRVETAGSLTFRGETFEIAHATIAPGLFAAGQPSPVTLTVAAPGLRATLAGDLQAGSDPRLTGEGTLELRSPRDFSRWSGIEVPLAATLRKATVSGEFSLTRRAATWPSVSIALGPDVLEGSLSMRLDGRRAAITGTLATNRIDLTDFFAPFLQARTASGLWSGEEASLDLSTGGDLDLRVSAADAVVGRLKLSDVAASILVRPGRIEASLGRAGIDKGSLKGRLVLSEAGETTDLKLQGNFDQVDIASFLAETGQPRWITGLAQGQVILELGGSTVVDLVRQSHGKATIVVRQGELLGIGLADSLKRIEKRPLAGSTDWKGGRTVFDQAHVALNIGAGVGEIVDGAVTASNLRTTLHGRVSLIERAVMVRALVDPALPSPLPSPMLILNVAGSWDDVAIVPDAKPLIERSGAAKPLFGSVPRAQQPLATAQ